jgi:hypothetical protein
MLPVGTSQYFTFVWPGGAQQPFIVHTGYHVLHPPVAIFIPHLRIKWLKAGRQNDRPYVYFYLLRLLPKIYGVILTDTFANATFLLFEIKTALINICHKGNGLSVVYMDGLILRYFLIILIGVLGRAVFHAGRTTRAFVLFNVSGLLDQGYLEVSRFPFYTVNLGISQNLYIWMPADLDQFGGEDSHRAVIGGEGLVKLGHMAAYGR